MIPIKFIGIDPSTKTGFVALDKDGHILMAEEVTGQGNKDPKRMVTLVDNLMQRITKDDIICVEGFSYGSKGNKVDFQFGLGHAIRNAMFTAGIEFTVVAPSQLKKFATGKGNTAKENMILPIYKRWEFENESDNVRDAYVLAQIARSLTIDTKVTKYQSEVLEGLK